MTSGQTWDLTNKTMAFQGTWYYLPIWAAFKLPLSFHFTGWFIEIPLFSIHNILGSKISIIINQQGFWTLLIRSGKDQKYHVNFDSEILQLIREWHSCTIFGISHPDFSWENMGKPPKKWRDHGGFQWEIHRKKCVIFIHFPQLYVELLGCTLTAENVGLLYMFF